MRTSPVPGSDPKPGEGGRAAAPDDTGNDGAPPTRGGGAGSGPNDDRLRLDKPPHY